VLKLRIISGSLLVAIFAAAGLFLPALGVWIVLMTISTLGQLEFYALLNRGGIPVFRFVGIVSGALMISATFFSLNGRFAPSYVWENAVLLGTLLAMFVRQFPQKDNPRPMETLGCTILGILYVPYLLNYITRLLAWDVRLMTEPVSQTGRLLAFFYIAVVKSADVGAFFVGSRFGRHRILPRISPKKTWEGLAGGIGAAILCSFAFFLTTGGRFGLLEVSVGDTLALAVLLTVAGLLGDMFESLVKRSTNMKDSSTAIPGMGGILDVLDSLLFGAPVMYVYARLML
jgi:phosphatidate cytidylyltransferase